MHRNRKNCEYCLKIDCWSLGICLFEMLCNELPFCIDSKEAYKTHILYSSIDFESFESLRYVSSHALDILTRLLDKDPATRLSASDALNHPWFDDLRRKPTLVTAQNSGG